MHRSEAARTLTFQRRRRLKRPPPGCMCERHQKRKRHTSLAQLPLPCSNTSFRTLRPTERFPANFNPVCDNCPRAAPRAITLTVSRAAPVSNDATTNYQARHPLTVPSRPTKPTQALHTTMPPQRLKKKPTTTPPHPSPPPVPRQLRSAPPLPRALTATKCPPTPPAIKPHSPLARYPTQPAPPLQPPHRIQPFRGSEASATLLQPREHATRRQARCVVTRMAAQ